MQTKRVAISDAVFIDAQTPDDLVELGLISAAHGVRGLVKVQSHSDDPGALLNAKTWWLKAPDKNAAGKSNNYLAIQVDSCHKHGQNTLLVRFGKIQDRNQAELLQFYTVSLSRADFPDTSSDEYYWVDLIGCDFYGLSDENQAFLGRVNQVTENAAHAILDVQKGRYDENGEFIASLDNKSRPIHILVPFVTAHVTDVDLQAKQIISNWPVDF